MQNPWFGKASAKIWRKNETTKLLDRLFQKTTVFAPQRHSKPQLPRCICTPQHTKRSTRHAPQMSKKCTPACPHPPRRQRNRAPLATPKKHTNEAHKPRTKSLRAASAKQNHTFCWAKPYVSYSKTIPFARQNHTFRATTQTPLWLNNLQYALRESASRKAQMAEKDTRELGQAAGKA